MVAAKEDLLVVLAKTAAPTPVTWINATGVQQAAGLKVRHWLGWPREPTPWSKKCETQPWRAWALWSALRGLGIAEGERGLVEVEPVGREHVLAVVDGVRLVTGEPDSDADVRVALGGVGHDHLVTPGLRLEDAFTSGGAGELLELELTRALGWLAADVPLGLVALCGPLSQWVYGGSTEYRRGPGYLDSEYGLTLSGWWRLAYEAMQGVGPQERTRGRLLKEASALRSTRPPRGRRRIHLRHTQRLVLKLHREEELVPLGVEFSALGRHFGRELSMRADALMVDRGGEKLVWVEYLHRRERDFNQERREQYVAKREKIAEVANAIGRPVEFYMAHPDGVERWAKIPTGWSPSSVVSPDLWTEAKAAAEEYVDHWQASDEEAATAFEMDSDSELYE